MSNYTTGEIAKLCGVSVRTVQYYDARGILVPSSLTEGGRRSYSEDDLSKMKIICFLRELGLPLDAIARLLQEENSREVVSLILEEQERELAAELEETEEKLGRLRALWQTLNKNGDFSLKSIGDVAHLMENRKKLRRLRTVLLLTGIPMGILEWGSIALWIVTGIWWPFLVYTAMIVPYGIWVTRYYFGRVAYICPTCHEIFVPRLREAFFARHTPNTRRLTCPHCGYHGYCVETARGEKDAKGE